MRFKQFILDIEYLKKTQIKLKGLDNKLVIELGANKCTGQEFLNYYPTFLVKFAEKCQKKWSKKDKCMLLWVIVRFIQLKGQKTIEDLSQENYDDLQEILGIKKQVIIQQISQIICLKTSKNPFSVEEKNKLIELIKQYEGKTINWCSVAQQFNNSFEGQQTLRTIKALKQVYINHLNPLLNKSCWQSSEDVKLISIIQRLGKKWQQAANIMKTRNQCQVKNQYYKLLREQMHKEKIPCQKKLDLQQELQILEVYKQQIMAQENIKEIDLDFQSQQLPSHIVAPILKSEQGSNIVSIKMDDISLSLTNSQHLQDYQKIQSNNEISNQSVTQNCHQQSKQQFENYNLKYQKQNEFQSQQIQYNKQQQNQEQQLLGQNNYNNYSENINQIQQENMKYDQYSSEYQELETQANIESIIGSENIQLYPQSDQNIDISNKQQSFLSAQQSPQNTYNIMYNDNFNNVQQQQSFVQEFKHKNFMENNNQDYQYDFECYQDNYNNIYQQNSLQQINSYSLLNEYQQEDNNMDNFQNEYFYKQDQQYQYLQYKQNKIVQQSQFLQKDKILKDEDIFFQAYQP
ncbi:Homeodomain protein [Pseudocohnilembus persalinus]|uniref:Homeodomain protein n=1 Tax=Pseudocohnilembus persalinus TaxID=266149 RepID=A0A0V0QQ06_PSEPJ|nr:Homeodomain protein [Pseudocohnilembus persalinus]|eukprot:KRX04064.1 Homeodomain protein [Pseudocohnilembus persalinus]